MVISIHTNSYRLHHLILDEIVLSVDEKEYGKIVPPEKGFVEEKGQLEIDAEVAEKWKKGSKLAPFDKEVDLCRLKNMYRCLMHAFNFRCF